MIVEHIAGILVYIMNVGIFGILAVDVYLATRSIASIPNLLAFNSTLFFISYVYCNLFVTNIHLFFCIVI